jgi:hypothetical protein
MVQLLIGFVLFVVGNASAQGLIPDTDGGKWLILVCTSLALFMQKVGLDTPTDQKPKPDQKDDDGTPDPGGNR